MRTMVVLSAVALLSACAGSGVLDSDTAERISVSAALTDIGAGLHGMQKNLGDFTAGLFACSVVVTLTVSASAAGESEIALASAQEIEITSGANRAENRGNTVEVAMYNAACLPDGTLGHENPMSIAEANRGMTAAGGEPAAN